MSQRLTPLILVYAFTIRRWVRITAFERATVAKWAMPIVRWHTARRLKCHS